MPRETPTRTAHDGKIYEFKGDHRDGTSTKSQWTISIDAEFESFELAGTSSWLRADRGWGLRLVDGKADYLGVSPRRENLFIARFRCTSSRWHGYPGDPRRRRSDVPVESVLLDWLLRKHLRKKVVSRLLEGAPCDL